MGTERVTIDTESLQLLLTRDENTPNKIGALDKLPLRPIPHPNKASRRAALQKYGFSPAHIDKIDEAGGLE